jgi:hypothetical protein
MIAAEGRGDRANPERKMKKLVIVCALLGLPALASAQYGQGPGGGGMGGGMGGGQMGPGGPGGGQGMGGGRPPGPPQEFITACQGKAAGATVSVNTPHGQMQGTCQLVFIPSQQGQGQGQGMGQGGGMGQGRQQPGGQRPQR